MALSQIIRNKKDRRSRNGKLGAASRWDNHTPSEDDALNKSYHDRKGKPFAVIELAETGIVLDVRYSTNRKDQVDVFQDGVLIDTLSPIMFAKKYLSV